MCVCVRHVISCDNYYLPIRAVAHLNLFKCLKPIRALAHLNATPGTESELAREEEMAIAISQFSFFHILHI